jgi:hypothetical protein
VLHLRLEDFMQLTPVEFKDCVEIYNTNNVNKLNDQHYLVYNAIAQTKSRKPFKSLIRDDTNVTSIDERKDTINYFQETVIGGEILNGR